jgi:pimeloyl-ACP methyl ester carboxylesterase
VPTAPVASFEVSFDDQGAGDPVVLVHGTTGSRFHWLLQTPALAARFRVVLPEYSGSGETTDAGGPLELDDLVTQVAGVADHLGLDRYHLAGWSLGAEVAAGVAADHPDRVRSLALVSGWIASDAHLRFQFELWQRLLAGDPETFMRFACFVGLTPGWFSDVGDDANTVVGMAAATIAPGSVRQAELDGRIDIAGRLPAITAPTLVIGGMHDRIVPVEHQRALAAAIAGARLVELDCGHLVPTERGDELAKLLGDWFETH